MINRFSVPPLFQSTKKLAKIASGIIEPDLVLFNARVLSTYTDRILENKEIWVSITWFGKLDLSTSKP